MRTANTQQVAAIVREARVARGLTQKELADAVGVHAQTIGNIENARYRTAPELLVQIERVLGVELSAAAIAARESVALVSAALMQRLDDLGDIEGLMLVGETLRYVAGWAPGLRSVGDDERSPRRG